MSFQSIIEDSDIIDGLSVRYLKFFGLWKVINAFRTTGKKNTTIKLQLLGTILLATPYLSCQLWSYFVIKVDIEKATILNINAIPACQMLCRILVFWFWMESQCRLYNLLRKDFLENSKKNVAEVAEIYKNISKSSNFFCTLSLTVNLSIVLLYVIYPGISVDYILYHTGNMAVVKTGRKKILGGWYPFGMGESPYFEVIYVYEAIVLMWGGFFLQAYFVLYYQVLMCLYAHFCVLGYKISSLKVEHCRKKANSECFTDYSNDSTIYKELYQILKDHQKLLRYTEELRGVYNPLVTMTLGMGILVLIIGAFQFLFAETGDPVYVFRFMQLMAYQGIEVSLLCFGSSSVQSASSELQFAIYSSDWYKADIKFRKTAQMVMVRATRGVTLTAIRMYPVNVETLMAILQFTYSVSTLMSRMTE